MTHIHAMKKVDKPREKLLARGAQSLKDYELLAVLLGSGMKGKDVLSLAKEISQLITNDFEGLSLDKLTAIHGLGKAKAMQILSAIELSRRHLIRQNVKITSSEDVYRELFDYRDKKQEHFIVITLDGANHIIEKRVVFIGTLNHSLVHPREVFADAIGDRAASIIIAHNHPSGQLSPSDADVRITRRLNDVAKMVGIELLDHLILTKEGYFSFDEEGML